MLLTLTTLFATLGACTSIPTLPSMIPQINFPSANYNTIPKGKDIQQANSFLNAGNKRGAASAYFNASKNYQSPERERLMLQASELAASFKDNQLAQRYLAPLNYASLNTENKSRYRFSQALFALNDRNYPETLRLLPQRVNGLPIGLAEKILKTRMVAAKSSQNKLALVQELVLQEPTLSKAHQVKLNNNRIWSHVLNMPQSELDKGRKTINHPVLKGWLELGYLVHTLEGNKAISSGFRTKLLTWQQNYPNHPGNEKAIQLINYKPITKVTPYLGGLKPAK